MDPCVLVRHTIEAPLAPTSLENRTGELLGVPSCVWLHAGDVCAQLLFLHTFRILGSNRTTEAPMLAQGQGWRPEKFRLTLSMPVVNMHFADSHRAGRSPSSPLKKAPLTGFYPPAKHIAAKAVSPFSETMRTI